MGIGHNKIIIIVYRRKMDFSLGENQIDRKFNKRRTKNEIYYLMCWSPFQFAFLSRVFILSSTFFSLGPVKEFQTRLSLTNFPKCVCIHMYIFVTLACSIWHTCTLSNDFFLFCFHGIHPEDCFKNIERVAHMYIQFKTKLKQHLVDILHKILNIFL
jgi:hypothetical protein